MPLAVASVVFLGSESLWLVTIFYCLRFETSLFVAYYDSQGHGGGIRPRLHTGLTPVNQLRVLSWPGADRRQNTHLNGSSVVICVSVATVMWVHQKPLSSNCLFRIASEAPHSRQSYSGFEASCHNIIPIWFCLLSGCIPSFPIKIRMDFLSLSQSYIPTPLQSP
jgi:hypothetical protein